MSESIKEEFENRLFMYPSDTHYICALGEKLGLHPKQYYKLFSIMGGQELSNTLPLATYRNFQCLAKNDFDFRFNLHTHTYHSDGVLSPLQVLEQSTKIANHNAKTKSILPPFTIAITDHNNINAQFEVLKELIKNPEKYQHLRVVLGCELGAVWEESSIQKYPFTFELLYYGLNPFDEQLNTYLQQHLFTRQYVSDQIFKKLQKAFPNAHLSQKEAFLQDPILAKNLSFGTPGRIYAYSKSKIIDNLLHQQLYDICYSYHHAFGLSEKNNPNQPYQDLFDLQRQSGFGFLGVAHPQKMNVGNFLSENFIKECNEKELNAGYEMIYMLLNRLKSAGLQALEINYQFDLEAFQNAQKMLLGQIPIDEEDGNYKWLKIFKDYAQKYGLLESGGYDTHSSDIMGR